MQAQEFVKRVKGLLPPVEDFRAILQKNGFEEEGMNSLLKRYSLPQKNEGSYEKHDDPIIELVTNFDLFGFYVGAMGFEEEITFEAGKVIFGFFDSDTLSINPKTGQIELFSHDNEEQHLLDCATSSSQFLDAFFIATELFVKRIIYEVQPNDHELNQRYIEQCTLLAGGEDYEDFFTELLEMREFN